MALVHMGMAAEVVAGTGKQQTAIPGRDFHPPWSLLLKGMRTMQKKKINTKALTSFLIASAFFMSSISGIILYITPQGRIAHWNTWTMLGLDKEQWGAVHTLFVLTLLIAATFHLFVFNWKVFMAYLKQKHQKGIRLKRELAIVLTLTLAVLVGTLVDIPPFGTVVALGENIKDYWATTEEEPPVPHAEDMTLAAYAKEVFQVDAAQLIALLKKNDITANPDDRLGDVADRSGNSPNKLHNLLAEVFVNQEPSQPVGSEGAGYGQMTFAQLCKSLQVDIVEATHRLQNHGIIVERSSDKIKALAERYGWLPIDMINAIQ